VKDLPKVTKNCNDTNIFKRVLTSVYVFCHKCDDFHHVIAYYDEGFWIVVDGPDDFKKNEKYQLETDKMPRFQRD